MKKWHVLWIWVVILSALLTGFTGCGASDLDFGISENAGDSEFFLSDLWKRSPAEISEQKVSDGQETVAGAFYDRYFLCDGSRYWYQTLSESEKVWYANMEDILGSMTQKGDLTLSDVSPGLTEENIDHVFQCVMMDHPELFYVDGYVYSIGKLGDKIANLSFSGTYNVSREVAEQKKAEIEKRVAVILQGVPLFGDDYEKVKYVYETLIMQTDYDLNAADNQNIYSVFIGGLSVCQGYAKATQYLLNQLGVECTLVSGTVQGGNRHGWNLVKADGEYYYVDTTWGDASYQTAEEERKIDLPVINYDFLCVTTEELNRTHRLDDDLELPYCTAILDNYFVREGAYFIAYDEAQIKELFQKKAQDGEDYVTLKCASAVVFDRVKKELIDDGKIFQFYDHSVGTVVYVQNEDQYSLTFWVTNP